VFEASPSAWSDGREGAVTLVNQELERLFGWRRDELIGKKVEVLVPERFRNRHPATGDFTASPRRGPWIRTGLFGLRKDGSEFPVEIGLKLSEWPGVLIWALSSTSPPQEGRGDGEGLHPAPRGEQPELKDFVNVASHDLKNPPEDAGIRDLLRKELGSVWPTADKYLVISRRAGGWACFWRTSRADQDHHPREAFPGLRPEGALEEVLATWTS